MRKIILIFLFLLAAICTARVFAYAVNDTTPFELFVRVDNDKVDQSSKIYVTVKNISSAPQHIWNAQHEGGQAKIYVIMKIDGVSHVIEYAESMMGYFAHVSNGFPFTLGDKAVIDINPGESYVFEINLLDKWGVVPYVDNPKSIVLSAEYESLGPLMVPKTRPEVWIGRLKSKAIEVNLINPRKIK